MAANEDGLIPCPRCFGDNHRPGGLACAHQAAHKLGMKVAWVYARTRSGELPHVPLGRYKRYRIAALDDYIVSIETGG